MNINKILLERAKNDVLTCKLHNASDKKVIQNDILYFIHKRIENNINQSTISKYLGVSLRTLQRFEKFEVNDLILYLNYKNLIDNNDLNLFDSIFANKQLTLHKLDEAIKKAKPNMDNIKDVDKHLNFIDSDFCKCDGIQDLHAMTGECRKCGKECDY